MTFPANPTSASAVVGDRLRLVSGPGVAAVLKGLTMPALLVAFATYLLVGIVTMRVPEGTTFPGPQFFPAIIAAGLYAFAALLVVGTVRELRAAPGTATARAEGTDETDAPPAERAVRIDVRSMAWVVVSFAVFALALNVLGWLIAASLLFWCVARGFGARKPLQTLAVGLTVSATAYIGFDMMLGLPLPSGILGGF